MIVDPAAADGAPPPAAAAADSPPSATAAPSGLGLGLPLLIAAGVILLDQLTKHWALNNLQDENLHLFWTLQLNLNFNSGMAFSTGSGVGPVIGAVAIVVIIGLAVSARRAARDSKLAAVAAGLVIGGAIGNLLDRLFRDDGWLHGSVVDFIDPQWFPIFNVADAAITIGGILFVVWTLRRA